MITFAPVNFNRKFLYKRMLRFLPRVFHVCKASILSIFLFLLVTGSANAAPDGKALFQANCASCHNVWKDATGPKLRGISERAPSKEWIYSWVKNSSNLVKSGDKYALEIFGKWKTVMTPFPSLSNEDIDAIVTYIETAPDPNAAKTTGGDDKKNAKDEGSNTLLYAILCIILLVAVVVLTQVNKILSRTRDEKIGVSSPKDVPFFRNKAVIALFASIALILVGVWLTKGSEFGRQKNYMPKQPIFFSHKVHAGINQINCQYCHSAVEKSRHAMIPSTNVCMNCHKQINEYSGAETHPLVNLEGDEVNGTEEIKKLYTYTGWDPEKKEYKRDSLTGEILAKPFDWIKIHNLPDHVYFNHSLHVVSGKLACQRCHGGIQEMDEVYQFSDLSMGWCINCHRETKVQFVENDYYSIFQKYHQEIKEGKREDVKVSDIGGLECQKCHY